MLKRLKTDRNRPSSTSTEFDPEVPIEDVAGAVKDLVDKGKSPAGCPRWGPTCRRAPRARAGHGRAERIPMLSGAAEKEVIPLCEKLESASSREPLGVAFLTVPSIENSVRSGDIRGRAPLLCRRTCLAT